jgi:hypothetical protein
MNHTCTTPRTIRGGGEIPFGPLPIYLVHDLYDKHRVSVHYPIKQRGILTEPNLV